MHSFDGCFYIEILTLIMHRNEYECVHIYIKSRKTVVFFCIYYYFLLLLFFFIYFFFFLGGGGGGGQR